MGIFRTTIVAAGWGSLAVTGTFVTLTRKCRIEPVDPTDYIFNHTLYARYNPHNSPATQDVCLRRVPLDRIRPELLEREGALAEAFCAGVWSGPGYEVQRRYLERKYRGPETAGQLWDRGALRASSYEVGTQITDHFEVVGKTAESVMVRCGDSPRLREVRESDGLFEMTAEVKKEQGVVEFGLKSVFFNGLSGYKDLSGAAPMPWHIQWLHQLYDKVLMESAVGNVTR